MRSVAVNQLHLVDELGLVAFSNPRYILDLHPSDSTDELVVHVVVEGGLRAFVVDGAPRPPEGDRQLRKLAYFPRP